MDSKLSPEVAPECLQRVRVVLCQTSHPGNIGSAARALKTMGLSRLVLVKPKIFPDPQAIALASGAVDVLDSARVCDSLADALEGVVLAVALTARRRDLATSPLWARDAASELAEHARQGEVALVFGHETSGLSNEELALCNRWAMIPANPAYSSLNLAAAVQLMSYELRLAMMAVPPAPTFSGGGEPARHDEVEGLIGHLEASAIRSGFLDPAAPGRLMLRLRRLFSRAALEREEVNILRGLLSSFEKPTRKQHR